MELKENVLRKAEKELIRIEGRTGKTEKIDEIHSDIGCFLFTLHSWSVIITVKTAGRHLFEDSDNRKR